MTNSEAGRVAASLRRLALGMAAALIVAPTAGCGESAEDEARLARRDIEVAEVPEAALEAAREALPRITIDEAWMNVDGDGELHSYELRGRSAETGKIREVRVTTDGRILEME